MTFSKMLLITGLALSFLAISSIICIIKIHNLDKRVTSLEIRVTNLEIRIISVEEKNAMY